MTVVDVLILIYDKFINLHLYFLVFSSLRKNYANCEIALLGKGQKKKMCLVSKICLLFLYHSDKGENARTMESNRFEFKSVLPHFPTA